MGALAPGSWLPALPDGSSLGPRPAALPDRYAALYQQFTDAWRVTDATSLFDYAPGTSTDTFTLRSWPREQTLCTIPASPTAQPATRAVAENACSLVRGTTGAPTASST
jgi:lysyl endopeptidase